MDPYGMDDPWRKHLDDKEEVHRIAVELASGFGFGFDRSVSDFLDGFVIENHNGKNVAMFLACNKSRVGDPKSARDLARTLAEFQEGSPFIYTFSNLSQDQRDFLSRGMEKTKIGNTFTHLHHDSMVYIIGGSVPELKKEMTSAKRVLSALGLRAMGEAEEDDDLVIDVSVQKSNSFAASLLSEISYSLGINNASSKIGGFGYSRSSQTKSENKSETISTTDTQIPFGATKEWIFLKAIATAAGCPNQPTDSAVEGDRMISKDPKVWKNEVPVSMEEWEKSLLEGPLKDASKIRSFIVKISEKIIERLHEEESINDDRIVDHFDHLYNDGDSKEKKLWVNSFWYETMRQNLKQVVDRGDKPYANDARSMEDLFQRLAFEAGKEKGTFNKWGKNALTTLRYASRLLDIVESTAAQRHLLYLQNRDKVNENLIGYPVSLDVHADKDGLAEGNIFPKDGILNSVFPILLQDTDYEDQKNMVLIPGASIDKVLEEKSLRVAVRLPEKPKYMLHPVEVKRALEEKGRLQNIHPESENAKEFLKQIRPSPSLHSGPGM